MSSDGCDTCCARRDLRLRRLLNRDRDVYSNNKTDIEFRRRRRRRSSSWRWSGPEEEEWWRTAAFRAENADHYHRTCRAAVARVLVGNVFFFFLLRVRRGTHRHYIIAYTGLSPSVVTHTLARAYTGVRVNAVSAFFYPVRRRFLFVGQVRPDDRFTSPTGIFSISAYIIYLHSIIYSITMSCTGYTDIH